MEFYNRKVRESYRRFLKNKRVVVVGPSPSIIGTDQGREIDQFDVVVRLNKALPIPPNLRHDVGTRTDVLYNCMNPSEECGGKIQHETLKRYRVKYLVGAYPPLDKMGDVKLRLKKDLNNFYKENRGKFNTPGPKFCYFDNMSHFNNLWKTMKLPNTGVMAILDLLKHEVKELYITGITFFKGGYYSEYRPYNEHEVLKRMARYDLHQQDLQLKYMSYRLLNSIRSTIDQPLRKVLENFRDGKESDDEDGKEHGKRDDGREDNGKDNEDNRKDNEDNGKDNEDNEKEGHEGHGKRGEHGKREEHGEEHVRHHREKVEERRYGYRHKSRKDQNDSDGKGKTESRRDPRDSNQTRRENKNDESPENNRKEEKENANENNGKENDDENDEERSDQEVEYTEEMLQRFILSSVPLIRVEV